MKKPFLFLALAVLAAFPASADLNFWSRAVYRAAQVYPLDPTVYTGWGPDWAGAGPFTQMSLGYAKGPAGFVVDTQFSGQGDLDAHVNFAQGWLVVVPDTLKLLAGKVRLDDHRWLTEVSDQSFGRFQTPDNWASAALQFTPKGLPLKVSLMVPAWVGTDAPSHLDASSTGPHTPANQTLADSLALADAAVNLDLQPLGLRLVAGTIGDTTAGGAYGSTGSDLGTGFGLTDPADSSRSWFGGLGWKRSVWNLWAGGTWWADPASAVTSAQHVQALAQATAQKGPWKVGLDAVARYTEGAPTGTLTQAQVVGGLTTGSYSAAQGPLTYGVHLAGSYRLRTPWADLTPGLTLGYTTQDASSAWGTYTFPKFDRVVDGQASLVWNPTGLTLGFDYKYDLDAQVATWVVPVTYTFTSY